MAVCGKRRERERGCELVATVRGEHLEGHFVKYARGRIYSRVSRRPLRSFLERRELCCAIR